MPLWGALSLFFILIACAVGAADIYFSQQVLTPLLGPANISIAAAMGGGLSILVLLLVLVLFFFLARWVAVPVRRLSRAIKAFTLDGTRVPTNVPIGAPKEIRDLTKSFAALLVHVENLHKRDVEISRVKSDFISTAAHQLRTPLTGIRWALEAIEASNPTSDQQALIASALDKSKELVAIVGTLLDISSIESGKYKYKFGPVDMTSLLDDIVRDFRRAADEHRVALSFAPSGVVPPVRADVERIKWVLNNLVENAIHYTPEGGSVELSFAMGAESLLIKVKDTGIGILPEDRGNIFERFFRGKNAVNKENEGNGLGLYIARTVATDHGGDLTFAPNSRGPGTTFTLTLPLWQ